MSSNESPPRPEDTPDGEVSSSPFLKFGALAVIGAVAANVFGFRYSRWAVGKEIHRGWERHARNQARSSAQARAEARRESSRRVREAEERARAERERVEREKRRYDRREDHSSAEKERMRGAYQHWEETFTNGGYTRRVKVEFDGRFEDMFRGPFGIPEEVLKELFRAAQMGGNVRGRRAQDFDAFKFWEEIHGAEWRRAGMGGGTGNTGRTTGMGGFRGGLSRHYAALGIPESATPVEVKAAYRKEAMKWHPDRYRGNDKPGAERRFREVTEAYEALKQT